jgi:hypothetical protein
LTIVAKSAIKVRKLWTGSFSGVFLVAALARAFFERLDGATIELFSSGSTVTFSSSNSSGANHDHRQN